MKLFFLSVITVTVLLTSCKKAGTDTVVTPAAKDSVITTVAGNGTAGFSGDGALATAAQLSAAAQRMYADAAGNIYISDGGNHRIRKVSTTGIITTIAGTGTSGFSGDGGPATAAQISSPQGITADAAGNIYFADENNDRIRKISTAGIITTVAGNGKKFSANYGDGGPATADTVDIHLPQDIAIDKEGNLIIADWAHHRIRKVTAATGIISTIAGKGLNSSGDGGPATAANLPYPTGLAIDGAGNIFIATDQRIRKIATNGIINTVAGTGNRSFNGHEGLATSLNIWPTGIAINNTGELVIADYGNSLVRKVKASGIMITIAGGPYSFADGVKPTKTGLTYPTGVVSDAAGNIYIADYGDRRIRKITVK